MSDVVLKVLWIYGLMAGVAMLIAGVIKLIVWLLNLVEREPSARPAPAAGAARAVPPEHLAVITAAVYAAIGAHRIVHIEDPRSNSRWGLEGRLTHQRSHKPPTHRPSH